MHGVTSFHVTRSEPLPKSGPLLLVANHVSHFDPPALSASTRLMINYMTDKKMLQSPGFGWFLRTLETFPIDRARSDRKAVKTALERLKQGRVVGIFPEGGIRDGKQSVLGGAEMPAGAPALWQMAQCPAMVACVVGTDQLYVSGNLLRRPRTFVRFGPVLSSPDRKASRSEIGKQLAAELHRLYREMDAQFTLRPEERPQSAQTRWEHVEG